MNKFTNWFRSGFSVGRAITLCSVLLLTLIVMLPNHVKADLVQSYGTWTSSLTDWHGSGLCCTEPSRFADLNKPLNLVVKPVNGSPIPSNVLSPGQQFYLSGTAISTISGTSENQVWVYFSDIVNSGASFPGGDRAVAANYPYGWISGFNNHSHVYTHTGSTYQYEHTDLVDLSGNVGLGKPSTSISYNTR